MSPLLTSWSCHTFCWCWALGSLHKQHTCCGSLCWLRKTVLPLFNPNNAFWLKLPAVFKAQTRTVAKSKKSSLNILDQELYVPYLQVSSKAARTKTARSSLPWQRRSALTQRSVLLIYSTTGPLHWQLLPLRKLSPVGKAVLIFRVLDLRMAHLKGHLLVHSVPSSTSPLDTLLKAWL